MPVTTTTASGSTTTVRNKNGVSSNSSSSREYVLLQELPDWEIALRRATASLNETRSRSGATTATADACSCTHLERILPPSSSTTTQQKQQILDMTLVEMPPPNTSTSVFGNSASYASSSNNKKKYFMFANPITALHLQSQLDDPMTGCCCCVVSAASDLSTSSTTQQSHTPTLYGEEQDKWNMIRTMGISNLWHPWIITPPRDEEEEESSSSRNNHHDDELVVYEGEDANTKDSMLRIATLKQPLTRVTATASAARPNTTTPPDLNVVVAVVSGGEQKEKVKDHNVDDKMEVVVNAENESIATTKGEELRSNLDESSLSSSNKATVVVVMDEVLATTTTTPTTFTSNMDPAQGGGRGAPSAMSLSSPLPKLQDQPPPAVSTVSTSTTTTTIDEITPTVVGPQDANALSSSIPPAAAHPPPPPLEHYYQQSPLLSESQFQSYQAAQDEILQLRHDYVVSKRSVGPSNNNNKQKRPLSLSSILDNTTTATATTPSSIAPTTRTVSSSPVPATTTTAAQPTMTDASGNIETDPNPISREDIESFLADAMDSVQTIRQIQKRYKMTHRTPLTTTHDPSNRRVKHTVSNRSSNNSTVECMSPEQYQTWLQERKYAVAVVEVWMEHFRQSRRAYWAEQQRPEEPRQSSKPTTSFRSELSPKSGSTFGTIRMNEDFMSTNNDRSGVDRIGSSSRSGDRTGSPSQFPHRRRRRCCQQCAEDGRSGGWMLSSFVRPSLNPEQRRTSDVDADGDDLMQCLECTFIGCGAPPPTDTTSTVSTTTTTVSEQHSLKHYLVTNHKLAVTCGPKAQIYCFPCGQFVSHEIFEQERQRVDLTVTLPWLAWKEHPVQRSFEALQFLHVPDLGIYWTGMRATYPILVPPDHVNASRLCRERQIVFRGDVTELPVGASPHSIEFTVRQHLIAPIDRWRIPAPVGMYNLGNTCFMTAILHCLLHCAPLQKYFLRDVGHHHAACAIYRSRLAGGPSNRSTLTNNGKLNNNVCIACEMDRLFLQYFGSTVGMDVVSAVNTVSPASSEHIGSEPEAKKDRTVVKGEPLVTADMLAAAWKCGSMNHLAGYEQRDAHEFLHGFLDILGKHMRRFRLQVYTAINKARSDNAFLRVDEQVQHDEVKNLFEGTLRSVLVCCECGSKRTQTEPFLSISLPLSKGHQKDLKTVDGTGSSDALSVERCLRQFTMPEILSDPVHCPHCAKKTPTKKQHVISKLPKILCLHLKRFDAAQNRKIEDFVSFPSTGLNMGPYLPHWSEVSGVPSAVEGTGDENSMPQIAYDIFATVNHFGNMQSGHYVTNVKVKKMWYHCNDSHVVYAGVGDGEAEVLRSDGAYLLFYGRR